MVKRHVDHRLPKLTRQYAGLLKDYLSVERETVLQQAYELGRKCIARGLGVLDMARIHEKSVALCLPAPREAADCREESARVLEAAEAFFLEALSPFEAAHRGFREANLRLRQVNEALARRNAELDTMNRTLERSEDQQRELLREARMMQENLRELSSRILHVGEEERKRISRELHDEVGQALTAVSLDLAVLDRHGPARQAGRSAAGALKSKIADSQRLLEQAMKTVHDFARELRPSMLDELGLVPALRWYLKEYAGRTGLRTRFQGSSEEGLNGEQKTVLFRVAQESLTNVARHARAASVEVVLRPVRQGIRMQIKDDGRGFRVSRQRSRRLGLLGIAERVRLVNGRLAIDSAPGKGTTVIVEIPFEEAGGPTLPGPVRRRAAIPLSAQFPESARPLARGAKQIRNAGAPRS